MRKRRLALVLVFLGLVTAVPAHADFLVAIGHFSTGTGTSNIEVNISPSFQPKCLLFFMNGRTDTSDAVGGGTAGLGVGFATSTTSRRSVGTLIADNQTTPTLNSGRRNDAAVYSSATGGVDGLIDLVSLDADGFTVVPDDATSASRTVMYIALGGSDVQSCTTGTFASGTSPGNVAVTGVGFQPDTLWIIDAMFADVENNTTGLTGVSVGVVAGASPVNAVTGIFSDNTGAGNPSDAKRYSRVGESWIGWSTAGAVDGQGSVTAWDLDGFTFNVSNAPTSSRAIYFLAIKGGQYFVGNALTQTDTSTDITIDPGFAPSLVVVGSHNTTQSSAGTAQNHLEVSLGVATSTTVSRAVATLDEDNVEPTETAGAIEFGASIAPVLLNVSTADAIEGRMKVQASDLKTFRMDDADPSQSFFWTWYAGAAAAVGAGSKAGTLMRGIGR